MRRYDTLDGNDGDSVLGELAGGVWRLVVRHRRGVAASAGIMALVGWATANALFLQEGEHPSAFFETREPLIAQRPTAAPEPASDPAARGPVTRIVFDNDAAGNVPVPPREPALTDNGDAADGDQIERIIAAPAPDIAPIDPVSEIQQMLAALGFYDAAIDGISGPQTAAAIDDYKVSVGLRGIELSTEELLISLRNNMMVTAAVPRPRPNEAADAGGTDTVEPVPVSLPAAPPRPAPDASETASDEIPAAPNVTAEPSDRRIGEAAQAPVADPTVLRVQAGLRAFGNEAIALDGVPGAQTRDAIREFQTLFRLPVTGEIDAALVDKMVAVGLID